MGRTLEEKIGDIRDEIISRRVKIGLIIGIGVLLGYVAKDWTWEEFNKCRTAEKRVANPRYCYSGYSKQYKPVAMRQDSAIVYGDGKK